MMKLALLIKSWGETLSRSLSNIIRKAYTRLSESFYILFDTLLSTQGEVVPNLISLMFLLWMWYFNWQQLMLSKDKHICTYKPLFVMDMRSYRLFNNNMSFLWSCLSLDLWTHWFQSLKISQDIPIHVYQPSNVATNFVTWYEVVTHARADHSCI